MLEQNLEQTRVGEITKEALNANIERLSREIENLILDRDIYMLLLIKKEREEK